MHFGGAVESEAGGRKIAVRNRAQFLCAEKTKISKTPSPGFEEVLIAKGLKVVSFDAVSQVLILRSLREDFDGCKEGGDGSQGRCLRLSITTHDSIEHVYCKVK